MSPRDDEFLDIHAAAGQLGKCSPIRSCHNGDMFKGPCPYCGGSSDKVTVTSTHDEKILLFCHQCERSGQELAEAMGVSLRRKGSGNFGRGRGTVVKRKEHRSMRYFLAGNMPGPKPVPTPPSSPSS